MKELKASYNGNEMENVFTGKYKINFENTS
jgi:hypothetical protein